MSAMLIRVKRGLGIRAESSQFNWAVVEGTVEAPVLIDAAIAEAPRNFTEGEALSWFRARFSALLEQFKPGGVAIRYPEPIARGAGSDGARRRSRVEGVLLEAASTNALPVETGALVTISKNLGSSSAKSYLQSDELRGLRWDKLSLNQREAILVAASLLERELN